MQSGLEFVHILMILTVVVFLWALFSSDLQMKIKRSEATQEIIHLRPRCKFLRKTSFRGRTQNWNATQASYSGTVVGSSPSQRLSAHRKYLGLETEFDGHSWKPKTSRYQSYLVSTSAESPRDRRFLADLCTINRLQPEHVLVQQNSVPTLDLHKATTREAQILLYFLKNNRKRLVRIITGRGLHSANGRPTLKKVVEKILTRMKMRFEDTARGGAFDFLNV